jgi:hypothetical protein
MSLNVSSPLWRSSDYTENITNQVGSYRHNIQLDGGFWSASFQVGGGLDTLEEWIAEGLGRHVVAHSQGMGVAWEGFVNEISANLGRLDYTAGPLMDVSNIVDLVYSTVDTSGGGRPRVGVRANTGTVEHEKSQERWGVRTKILSSGGVNVDIAPQIRDMFLQENHEPPKTQRFMSDGAGEAVIVVHCLGYYHWLDYVYDQKVVTGDIYASAKLLDVLTGTDAATGNPYNVNSSWFDINTVNVDATNTSPIKAWEEKHKLAKVIIDGISVIGDSSLNRWAFGIYEDHKAYYQPVSAEVQYLQYITQALSTIYSVDNAEVFPWEMRPGNWMLFPDFMATRRHPGNLKEDPRAMFIETVDYTAPYTVAASSGPTARLNQMLGQLGLSGVGA